MTKKSILFGGQFVPCGGTSIPAFNAMGFEDGAVYFANSSSSPFPISTAGASAAAVIISSDTALAAAKAASTTQAIIDGRTLDVWTFDTDAGWANGGSDSIGDHLQMGRQYYNATTGMFYFYSGNGVIETIGNTDLPRATNAEAIAGTVDKLLSPASLAAAYSSW